MESFLTEKQKAILDFVEAFQQRAGFSPTYREISEAFGYSSYGTVHKHLKYLQEKGFLERTRHQKRGLRLTPPASQPRQDPPRLPFHGRIAAGEPIEAITGLERLLVPPHLLEGDAGEHYVLQVVGQSMVEEGIHDGDLVVVRRRQEAEPGEMIVALVDGEATLKRFYPEGELIRLQPANAAMKPLRVRAEDLRIQGIVIGLMRKF